MSHDASPVVQRRRLRAELRRARQEAGLTQETVADQMDWSLSKVIRIENGAVGISTNDLTALLRLYSVRDPKTIVELIAQGKEARKQSWWSSYRPVLPPTYFQYIEYETSASTIRSYETLIIPDLLQTEEYATIVARLYRPDFTSTTAQILAEVQTRRHELLLSGPDPPLLFFVLDEAVIQRLIGARSLRQAQLEKLIRMANRPEVTIEIVPFSVGLHRGMATNFSILEFGAAADSDVLYFGIARDSLFSNNEAEKISEHRELFEELRMRSLGPGRSRTYLGKIARDMEQEEMKEGTAEH